MFGMTGSVMQGGFSPTVVGGVAPTVNTERTAPVPAIITEGVGSIFWEITYNGDVTSYNLTSGEITLVGDPLGNIIITDGTTDTATVEFESTTGTGTIAIIVQAGACQHLGVDNIESDESDGGLVNAAK